MEPCRNGSFRNSSETTKFPDISLGKSLIRKSLHEPIKYKENASSSTPEPSLTVKLMKICNRPKKKSLKYEKIDYSEQYTSDTLGTLIKNSAVTFISPNDLINQLQNELNSPISKEK